MADNKDRETGKPSEPPRPAPSPGGPPVKPQGDIDNPGKNPPPPPPPEPPTGGR